jgi:hypothetical protein
VADRYFEAEEPIPAYAFDASDLWVECEFNSRMVGHIRRVSWALAEYLGANSAAELEGLTDREFAGHEPENLLMVRQLIEGRIPAGQNLLWLRHCKTRERVWFHMRVTLMQGTCVEARLLSVEAEEMNPRPLQQPIWVPLPAAYGPAPRELARMEMLAATAQAAAAKVEDRLARVPELIEEVAIKLLERRGLPLKEEDRPPARERESSPTKYPTDHGEFEAACHHAFDVIGDIPDADPSMINVALNWFPMPIATNTLRAGMRFHRYVPEVGRRDYARVLKKLYNEYHHLLDVAAAFVAVATACGHLHQVMPFTVKAFAAVAPHISHHL